MNERATSVSSHTYSGCYGGQNSNIGDIIITQIECPSYPATLNSKQIIFVVDESGSMCDTIISVKASLFAARNSLLRLVGHDISNIDESGRDQLFSTTCNVSLISFSNKARYLWGSNQAASTNTNSLIGHQKVSFSEAVNAIDADQSTNMGDALKMAFNMKISDYATWIILLTDGMSNKGPCQTLDSFKNLVKDIPPHTKIIPLGYTTNFDPDILSALGHMIYVDTEERIAEIFGGIIGEIVSCYGINAKITLPHSRIETINPDDIIVVPDHIGDQSRDVIGSNDVGCLFNDRKFIYGWLPWGNTHVPTFSHYVGLTGYLSYYDISRKIEVVVPFTIEEGTKEIPEDVCENYFESSKGRILLGIYQTRRRNRSISKYIDIVKIKLDDWKHPSALPHKEEIMRVLNSSGNSDEECHLMTAAISCQHQINYTSMGRHTTNTQRGACNISSREAQEYNTVRIDTSSIPRYSTY